MRTPLRLRTARAGLRIAAAALTALALLGTAQPARAEQSCQQPQQEASGRRTLMFWIGTWDFAGQGYAPGTRAEPVRTAMPRHKAVRRRPVYARRQQPQVRREHHSAPASPPAQKAADTHR
jgi:hypothetical protein